MAAMQDLQIIESYFSGSVTINDNSVVSATDIQGTNGVVHVFNKVLLPYELTL